MAATTSTTLAGLSPNFSVLGEIPGAIEEARGLSERRKLFEGLDSNDPESMESTARRLFATGNTSNMEMALKLQTAAQAKRASAHQIRMGEHAISKDAAEAAAFARASGLVPPMGGGAGGPSVPQAAPGTFGGGLLPFPDKVDPNQMNLPVPSGPALAPRAEAPAPVQAAALPPQEEPAAIPGQQPSVGPQMAGQQQTAQAMPYWMQGIGQQQIGTPPPGVAPPPPPPW